MVLQPDGKLLFPAATTRALKLAEYPSCRLYRDDRDPRLVAIQLCPDRGCDYRLQVQGGGGRLTARRVFRATGAPPGVYRLREETNGLLVIDFASPVERR